MLKCQQLENFHTQLSWAWKKFYNLVAWTIRNGVISKMRHLMMTKVVSTRGAGEGEAGGGDVDNWLSRPIATSEHCKPGPYQSRPTQTRSITNSTFCALLLWMFLTDLFHQSYFEIWCSPRLKYVFSEPHVLFKMVWYNKFKVGSCI